MKYYTIVYPDVTETGHEYDHWETLSEQEILNQYYHYWATKMIANGRQDISEEKCIQDWCLVHWAERNYWREIKEYYE
jgi:hypothetical protein